MNRQQTAVILGSILFFALSQPAMATVIVDSVDTLVAAVNESSQGGDPTILIADGTYNLNGQYLRITSEGVRVGSVSGNRDQIILDGNYQTTEIFQIVASNVTIQDLTLKRAQDHPIHVMGGKRTNTTGTTLHNLHILDPGQQAIKINTSSSGHTTDQGTITQCLIELTRGGRVYVVSHNGSCYTGGIDAHKAEGWRIQDNTIKGFWCEESLAEHGIHLWSGSSNTLVERNLIIDCDRGVGFGLGSSTHFGGIIRNNMIYHPQNHGHSDVGIGLESAQDAQVYNNTIYLNHSYANGIEYRFAASTSNIISNNLTNKQVSSRDGGEAELNSNYLKAQADWFVDAAAGDLHLRKNITEVVNQGIEIEGLTDDFDRAARPFAGGYDIGADEYGSTGPGKALPWILLLDD